MIAVETHELSKRYRRVSALTECSVTVPEGRVCALAGPNGAGKTTLLRLLAGLARPTGGTASVLGGAPRQVLVGPRKDTAPIEQTHKVVHSVVTARQSTLFVHLNGPLIDPAYQAEDVTLEELVLAYLGADEASAGKQLTTVGEGS
jgi:ABC-2 type transport system ATP-binding protein